MRTWKYAKRGGPAKALAVSTGRVMGPIFARRGFADGAIVNNWRLIVGRHIGAHSAPEKISYPTHQTIAGTLHLRIDSGGLAMELQHLQPQLIERINGYFGFNAVANIKITQGPLPQRAAAPPPPPPDLSVDDKAAVAGRLRGVEDADLNQALQDLGCAVAALGKTGKR